MNCCSPVAASLSAVAIRFKGSDRLYIVMRFLNPATLSKQKKKKKVKKTSRVTALRGK